MLLDFMTFHTPRPVTVNRLYVGLFKCIVRQVTCSHFRRLKSTKDLKWMESIDDNGHTIGQLEAWNQTVKMFRLQVV